MLSESEIMVERFDNKIGLWLFIFLEENVSSNLGSCLQQFTICIPNRKKQMLFMVYRLIMCRHVILSLLCERIISEKEDS